MTLNAFGDNCMKKLNVYALRNAVDASVHAVGLAFGSLYSTGRTSRQQWQKTNEKKQKDKNN